MPTLSEILADQVVDEDEVKSLFKTYDANGDGLLDPWELQEFAKEVVTLLKGSSVDDVLRIIDFFQTIDDGDIDPNELRSFLEIYVAK